MDQQTSKFSIFFPPVFGVVVAVAGFFVGLTNTLLEAALFLLLAILVSAVASRVLVIRRKREVGSGSSRLSRDPFVVVTFVAALVLGAFLFPRLAATQASAGTSGEIGADAGPQAAPGQPDGPVKLATITSEPNPQAGQDNRSSTNSPPNLPRPARPGCSGRSPAATRTPPSTSWKTASASTPSSSTTSRTG